MELLLGFFLRVGGSVTPLDLFSDFDSRLPLSFLAKKTVAAAPPALVAKSFNLYPSLSLCVKHGAHRTSTF